MKSKIKLYRLTAVALTVTLTVLRCLSLFFAYDTAVGYFNATLLSGFTTVLFIIGALWCLSATFFIPKESITTEFTPSAILFKTVSAYSAFLALLSSVAIATAEGTGLLEKLGAVSVALSALFFAFGAIKKGKMEVARAFLSITVVLSFVFILASVYFDMTIAMNSPHKILGGFAFMSAMIFGLCETRIYLSHSYAQKAIPRTHFAFGLLTLMLGFSFAVSSIIYRLASEESTFVTNSAILGNFGYIGAIAAISAYAAARCFVFTETASEA